MFAVIVSSVLYYIQYGNILIQSSSLQLALSDQNDTEYFGPITGRIAQRVARGRFVLDGKVYQMYRNAGRNTIHGTSR